MSDITWDKNGNPVFAVVSNAFISSKNKSVRNEAKASIVASEEKSLDINGVQVARWFDPNNDYPNVVAQSYLKTSPALQSAIDYKARMCLSQGAYAVVVEGIDNNGNEVLKAIDDPNVNRFLNSQMIRRLQIDAYKSMFSFGPAYPQIILRQNGQLAFASVWKAKNCRLEVKDDNGFYRNLLLLPDWSKATSGTIDKVPILNTSSWDINETIAEAKKLKKFCFPLGLSSAINSNYPEAPWDVSRQSGDLDISIKIAKSLDSMFQNQMSIKYHVRIPYSYWDKKFPQEEYPTPTDKKRRKDLITKEIDKIEDSLTKPENAGKAIVTHFEIGQSGKAEEQWIIDVIDDKFKNDMYLPHKATTNGEIYAAMGINPAVRGLSMSAGPYANNQGGSNIREAFLLDIALSWVDRQEVNDLLEILVRLTFPALQNVQIRSKLMVLTTLDSGNQTKLTNG